MMAWKFGQARSLLATSSGTVQNMKKMTLDKILQCQGFGTRKGCRQLIANGAVHVGGEAVTEYQRAFVPEGLEFTVDDEPWTYRAHLYIALNKPPGYECSRRPSHHPSVLKLLPEQFVLREVQSVGRLDHDTTGLLLLSDDGAFIHALSSPKRHVPKVYVATTHAPVTPELLTRLREGVQLDDEPAPLRAQVEQLDAHRLEIVLEQGKYHQVKRMLVAAGNHCVALCRVTIGSLKLDELELAEGRWCFLDPAQLALNPVH
jgi:16S rRNA pseudouridine516 synthase